MDPYDDAASCMEVLLNGVLTEWLSPVDSFQKIDYHKICGNLKNLCNDYFKYCLNKYLHNSFPLKLLVPVNQYLSKCSSISSCTPIAKCNKKYDTFHFREVLSSSHIFFKTEDCSDFFPLHHKRCIAFLQENHQAFEQEKK